MLRLPTIRDRFAVIAAAEGEQMTYLGFLSELVIAECDDRARRRAAHVIFLLPGTNGVGLEDGAARARRYNGQRLGDLGHRRADAVGQGLECREVEA